MIDIQKAWDKATFGIKRQKDGGILKPDNIYTVDVAEFYIQLHPETLKEVPENDQFDLIYSYKQLGQAVLKGQGLSLLGSRVSSVPDEEGAHVTLEVVHNENLQKLLDQIPSGQLRKTAALKPL